MKDYTPMNNRFWVAYTEGHHAYPVLRMDPYFEVKDRITGRKTRLWTTPKHLSLKVWVDEDYETILDLEQIANAYRKVGKDPIVAPLTCKDVHKFFTGGDIALRLKKA